MKINMYIPITITIVAGVAAYCYYRHKRKVATQLLTNELNQNESQRIDTLSIDNVLNWVNDSLSDQEFGDDELELNILPNKATIEAFKGKLDFNTKDISRCYLILILNNTRQSQVKRKLVIANHIGEEMDAIVREKVFAIRLK